MTGVEMTYDSHDFCQQWIDNSFVKFFRVANLVCSDSAVASRDSECATMVVTMTNNKKKKTNGYCSGHSDDADKNISGHAWVSPLFDDIDGLAGKEEELAKLVERLE